MDKMTYELTMSGLTQAVREHLLAESHPDFWRCYLQTMADLTFTYNTDEKLSSMTYRNALTPHEWEDIYSILTRVMRGDY